MTGETMEVTIYGKTYSIIAVDNEDGTFSKYPQCSTGSTGGGGAHNNMMPYKAVYYWRRTA